MLIFAGPLFMAAFNWETSERHKWRGRDRRRVKRERRKFLARAQSARIEQPPQ